MKNWLLSILYVLIGMAGIALIAFLCSICIPFAVILVFICMGGILAEIVWFVHEELEE